MLLRQFDSVWVFLISFVLFGKSLLEPLYLLFCNPLIDRRGTVAYEKFLATTVTPEVPISWKPTAFSRLLFFIATAFICAFPLSS